MAEVHRLRAKVRLVGYYFESSPLPNRGRVFSVIVMLLSVIDPVMVPISPQSGGPISEEI